MAPCPEQISIHHLVAPGIIGKEMHTEITIEQQHHERRGQDGEGGDDHHICSQCGPAKHWHSQISHAGRAKLPMTSDTLTRRAPVAVSQKLTELSTGNATSRTPSCNGTARFISPMTSGIATKKIMITPCAEKIWL